MRVKMVPHVGRTTGTNGIDQVVRGYWRHLPEFGVELVGESDTRYDVLAVHAGMQAAEYDAPLVAHCHGLYWTADLPLDGMYYRANKAVIDSLRHAEVITVPSSWVAEPIARDMRRRAVVVRHGVDLAQWRHDGSHDGYVLWNKNRVSVVCSIAPFEHLAREFKNVLFMSTFSSNPTPNVKTTGIVEHKVMADMVKRAAVYLSTAKETGGIGVMESLAAGVPVLGFREGANIDLVEHGQTGYLAKPGDLDDLAQGLAYCLQYRDALGANARESAQAFTWRESAAIVAACYELAMVKAKEPATASIVIPSYNYADKVGRAIESAARQDYDKLAQIVVVDDGSSDDGATEHAVKELADRYADRVPIRYIRQENAGVAIARNTGIAATSSKYVCCLDADDAIEPEYLRKLVPHLERDRSLGIVYSGLKIVLPDGRQARGRWPKECNFDEQLTGGNQVPTCCVFRRDVWESMGGYRQRYAPDGAGAEDAELWLRIGAAGWGIKQATTEQLFLYSYGTGRTTGDEAYTEPDWLVNHPWTRDNLHPFASLATAPLSSHPVRQYDDPDISVIIPVGPGHVRTVWNALDFLESQTVRRWEAILVNDTGENDQEWRSLREAFPYARIVDSGGKGAGAARNAGAAIARGDLIVFLDADDWMYPEYLERSLAAWNREQKVVYTDYVGRAFVEAELANELARQVIDDERRLLHYDTMTGEAVIRYQATEYDCELAQRQPEYTGDPNSPVYYWCLVTCLIPRAWHEAIGGFDESMETWEDVDYHWRLARAGYCYYHLAEPLIVYNFYTGNRRQRSQTGQTAQTVVQYIKDKYEKGGPVAGCSGCSGKTSAPPTYGALFSGQGASAREVMTARASDSDYIKVVYESRNKGTHLVYGPATQTDYGMHGGGDEFLVHKDDVYLPGGDLRGVFRPVAQVRAEVRPRVTLAQQVQETAPPIRQASTMPPPPRGAQALDARMSIEGEQVAQGRAAVPPPPTGPRLAADAIADQARAAVIKDAAPGELEALFAQQHEQAAQVEVVKGAFDLQSIPGISATAEKQLVELGVKSAADMIALGRDGLQKVRGIGVAKADAIIAFLTAGDD